MLASYFMEVYTDRESLGQPEFGTATLHVLRGARASMFHGI